MNDVTPEKMEKGIYKKFSFFKDQVEISPKTNKMILPISIKETSSKTIYRKSPKSEKTIIEGMNSSGIEEFFNTGDMLGTILTDVFSDVNIYDDDIRLLQRRFVSPIGRGAISFISSILWILLWWTARSVYTLLSFHRTRRTLVLQDISMS